MYRYACTCFLYLLYVCAFSSRIIKLTIAIKLEKGVKNKYSITSQTAILVIYFIRKITFTSYAHDIKDPEAITLVLH